MDCRDLKVQGVNIGEDYYAYSGTFRISNDQLCMDVNMDDLEKEVKLEEIKKSFSLKESIIEIYEILMQKVVDASKIESSNKEGKDIDEDAETDANEDAINRELNKIVDRMSLS